MDNKIFRKYEVVLDGKHKRPITLDVSYFENKEKKTAPVPLIILCHGFKGFKDWGGFNLVAKTIAAENFFFVKINFSHNGTSVDNTSDIHDVEAFGYNNLEIELDDLDTVINWLEESKNQYHQFYDFNELYLIGHSRGGGISLLKTVEDSRIKKVACWATVNDFGKYMLLSDEKSWRESGVSYVVNNRTKIKLPMYYQFFENYFKNEKRLNLKKNLMKLDKPLLLLHGTNDSSVPFDDAEWIYNNIGHSLLIKIEGADHTFGVKHPWEQENLPADMLYAMDETIEFFKM